MTEPQQQSSEDGPDLGEPTDVSVDREQVEAEQPDEATPTSSAARYEEDGDTAGGTGGLDSGGAG